MALNSGNSGLYAGYSGLGSNKGLYAGYSGVGSMNAAAALPASINIANLAAFWDASNIGSLNSAYGKVGQWLDLSGNGNHLVQFTDTNQPTSGTRTMNGLNVLDFDGTYSFMNLSRAITGGVFTVYFVALTDGLIANPQDIVSSSLGGGVEIRFANSASNGAIQVVRKSQSVLLTSSSNNSASTPYSFIITTSNSGNTVYKKGSAAGTNATSASYTNGIDMIGASAGGVPSTPLNGVIGEIAIYTRILSGAEITAISNYSVAKWAIP